MEEDHVTALVESAGKLLEAEGFILQPGVWGRWVVVRCSQPMILGWMAFLLPEKTSG